jgi:steroid delta-isomerase-like uncharacterized protein
METRELVPRAFARFNEDRDRAGFLEAYADDVVLHGYPEGLEGVEGLRRFHQELSWAFPDLELVVLDVLVDGDRAAVRHELRGTHGRTYLGVPSTGRPISIESMVMLRLVDGRIAEEWHTPTELRILRQLGATEAMTAASRRFAHPPRRSATADAAALRLEELDR